MPLPPDDDSLCLVYILENPGSTLADVAAGTGLARSAVKAVLLAGKRAGVLRADSPPQAGPKPQRYYAITQQQEGDENVE
ncbi:MAG: hypothetical protein Q8P18_33285 [Pseudomonadota bacterium]|nr:hypothetical protein [Pseudomonadota bacterium]